MSKYQVKRIRLVAASAAVTAIASCVTWLAMRSLPPHLVDQCAARGNPLEWAKIAVVGVIENDALALRPVPMRSAPDYPLQLRKLTIRVENVLRGELAGGQVDVFYFTWAGGFDGNQPLGFWRIGGRRIFLLRRDSGVLRTACDGADNCTWGVFSGAHLKYRADPNKPLTYAVADILLTRGEGRINEQRFAGEIFREAPAPFDYLIDRLGHLAETETLGTKGAACLGLWYYAHDQSAPSSAAGDWIRNAGCVCRIRPDGSPDCGPVPHFDDPPF